VIIMNRNTFWTVPNVLSLSRLLAAPVGLWLAYIGASTAYVWLLAASLITDLLDGKIARWLNQSSDWGARLDSWADFATYMTVPICAAWLRPDVMQSDALTFWAIVGAYTVPVLYGALKFGKLTSYHTRGAVISAYALGIAAVILFAGGPVWPLRLAALVLVCAELEEMAITTVLSTPRSNVKHLGIALRMRQAA
jgi:CDP-diacylglycerol--glycerol-3-phosphate 3-phosphatidyltransferase